MSDKSSVDPIDIVLDHARWAPSGDNTQPWRFDKRSSTQARVTITDTRTHCVYDLDGHATELAAGALIETARIGATDPACRARCAWTLESSSLDNIFHLHLETQLDADVAPSSLLSAIHSRAVYRFPLSTRTPSREAIAALEAAAGSDFTLVVFADLRDRLRVAWLNFISAKIRLTIREAWEVHRAVIEWNAQYSCDKIPDQALGADPVLRRVMKWGMQDWRRIETMNRYFAGTLAPRIELDLLPGIACGAHIGLAARAAPATRAEFIEAGRAIQRVWLTAEQQSLRLQPEMTPLIFSRYAREGRKFTSSIRAKAAAKGVADRFGQLFGCATAPRVVFVARLGYGDVAKARSTRRSLESLTGATTL